MKRHGPEPKEPVANQITRKARESTGRYRPEEHEPDLCEQLNYRPGFRLSRGFRLWKESEK